MRKLILKMYLILTPSLAEAGKLLVEVGKRLAGVGNHLVGAGNHLVDRDNHPAGVANIPKSDWINIDECGVFPAWIPEPVYCHANATCENFIGAHPDTGKKNIWEFLNKSSFNNNNQEWFFEKIKK